MTEETDWRERRTTVLADLYSGDYHLLTANEGNLARCGHLSGGQCDTGQPCATVLEPVCVTGEPLYGWRPLREEVTIPHPLPGVQYADGVA